MNRLCNMLMERHMLKSGEVSTHFMTAVIQGDIFCAQPINFAGRHRFAAQYSELIMLWCSNGCRFLTNLSGQDWL